MLRLPYFTDRRYGLFDRSVPLRGHANLGPDACNVTIVFLAMNRSSLSIRLLQSLTAHVPNFAGEVLIADNGSDANEIEALRSFCTSALSCRWRILEFGQNHGVAGGRNRAFAEVTTDWIFSLDNDIYLTADPFLQLQRDLALTGAHFLSVPLLNPDHATFYSFGGALQTLVQNGEPRLTITTVIPPGSPLAAARELTPEGDAFLCSFLYGGASLLLRESFSAQGGFDDGMFVGFEDIDFSLRLWRAGVKVGSSAIACFVHDHPPAEAPSDKTYERARFSRMALKNAALHLEAKHGFRVWGDEVETWLIAREQEQQLTPGMESAAIVSGAKRKPRIALVTDTADWAFANISRQIMNNLGDKYEFDFIPMVTLATVEEQRWIEGGRQGVYVPGGGSALNHLLLIAPDYDLVHVFWREYLTLIDSYALKAYVDRLGISYEEFRRRFIETSWLSTSVYDHLHCAPDAIEQRRTLFNEWTVAYTVSSERLARLYRSFPGLRAPAAVIEDGVSPELFYPVDLDRFAAMEAREVVVGWVGNSKWAASLGDKKGVHSILIPAIEELRAEGLPIRLELADRQHGFIPHHEMVHWYRTIDCYVCTSEIEGTPNPVLEAMACGVPVVTTDVGVVPEVFGPLQTEFILTERTIECLKATLRRLVSNRMLFSQLSTENLDSISRWTWHSKTARFDAFFTEVLERRAITEGECRTKICMLPFTTPSMETDGSIRLCSASSIFDYREETNMGNCRTEGLAAVWRNEKYRHIRQTLVTGQGLTPYCMACEYRHDGPSWLFQLHLALHAWAGGVRDAEVLALLRCRASRHTEYTARAVDHGLQPLPMPELEPSPPAAITTPLTVPETILDGQQLPIYIDLNTLNRCNVSCTMCPPAIRHDQLGIKRDPYFRLTLEEFEKITDGLNVRSAHFVGAYAEPLLNKDIFELVRRAHDRGMFTGITSNAMPLSRGFADRLLDAGLDMLSISLHGASAEVAEAIMMKAKFDRVLENIRGIQAAKKERNKSTPELYFNFVSQRRNVGEIAAFIRLAANLEVRHVNVIHLIDGDEAVNPEDNLVLHPGLLVPQLREALRIGAETGVNVHISPAYRNLMESWQDTPEITPVQPAEA